MNVNSVDPRVVVVRVEDLLFEVAQGDAGCVGVVVFWLCCCCG